MSNETNTISKDNKLGPKTKWWLRTGRWLTKCAVMRWLGFA